MSSWVKEVKLEDVKDGASYFLARQSGGSTNITTWHFYARDIKGKAVMSTKPGIAVRFLGGEPFRETLRKHTDLTAIEVPADADQRWRRRVKRFW